MKTNNFETRNALNDTDFPEKKENQFIYAFRKIFREKEKCGREWEFFADFVIHELFEK
ncbi:hypothetical protein [Pseudolactococcus insecticola]|nr:hypothetical protein [Lactococcus insecticola]